MPRYSVGNKPPKTVRPSRKPRLDRLRAAIEPLEPRRLLTAFTMSGDYNYIISGNTLVVNSGINPIAGSPFDLTTYSEVDLTGGTGSNTFSVSGNSKLVKLDGAGGGDTYTINAGSGGTVDILADANDQSPDAIVIHAPTATPATTTVSPGTVTVGGDTINNADTEVTNMSLTGQLSGSGDGLIINGNSSGETYVLTGSTLTATGEPVITYSNYTSLTINGNGGADSFTVSGISSPTTITAGAGNASFTVNSNNDLLTLDSGSIGTDTYTINGNSGTLIVNGGGTDDNFTVNNSASAMTLNGGTGANSYVIVSNSANLTMDGAAGDKSDNFHIESNSGTIHATAGSGTGTFTVDATTAPVTLTGGSGNDSFHITAPCFAIVTVVGGTGTSQTLEYDATPVNDAITLTGTKITGPLSPVLYSLITGLTINGEGGSDTFNVVSDSAPTTLIGSVGNDTFNIEADSTGDGVTVDTGSAPGASVVNIGSNAPSNGSVLSNIKGGVTVNGDGADSVNIDDSGDHVAKTGTLDSGDLSGLGLGANIAFSGIDTLGLLLGTGGNTLTVTGTSANTTNINTGSGNDFAYIQTTGSDTVTNLTTGAGKNTVDVGSTAPTAGGTLSYIQGALNVIGNGADLLNLDDSGSVSSKTGTLTPTDVSGLSPGDITYGGIATLTVKLGNQGNNFTISNTSAATVTDLIGGTGGDTIALLTDAGKTNITAGSGANQISINATAAATTVGDVTGSSAILIGSLEPTAGGLLSGIQSPLAITGNGNDTVTLDDTGDTVAKTGKMTSIAVTGLGLGATGVTYDGLGTLEVNLGSGGNTFTIASTSATVGTILSSGSGSDAVTISGDSTPTTVSSGTGNDSVNVQATGGATEVDLGSGTDTVYVSNNAPSAGSLQSIDAALTINGTTTTTVTLDDTGNPAPTTGALSGATLHGVAPADINYSGLGILNIKLGTGGNTLTVTGASATTTNLNSGSGADTIKIQAIGAGAFNLNTGGGTNVNQVYVGDPGGDVSGILGTLAITGNTHDLLTIDNANSTTANTATLTSTSITGLTTDPITWSGILAFTLNLGTQNNQLTIDSTITGNSVINGNGNVDTINLLDNEGPVTINTGAGNDVVYILDTGAAVVVNTNTGADTINVGSSSPPSSGVLAGIASSITVNGDGNDTLNLDDSGDASGKTGTITKTAVTGLSPAAIDYSSLSNLNVYLGSAVDTINIQSTSAATEIFTGAVADTINIGSGGLTSGITSPVTILGTASADIVTVDDSADTSPVTGTLSGTQITGVAPADINYSGVGSLTISLGSGGNTFTITNTNATTATTLNSGSGNDTVTLVADSGATTINTQGGSDTVYVEATGALTTINTGIPGADTIDVGSVLPPPLFNKGVLSGVTGKLVVNGNGDDTLNLDDSGDASSHAAAQLTATALTGLGAAEIDYSKLGALNLALGTGNNTLTITGTASGTSTAITTAGGADVFNIQATASPLSITTTGSGVNTFNVGSLAPATGGNVDGIVGTVTLIGDSNDVLNVDDTGSAKNRTGSLSGTALVLGPATIDYSGLATLNANLGTGADVFTVTDTAAGVANTLTTTVADTFDVENTAATSTLSIQAAGSASTVNITDAGLVSGIAGTVYVDPVTPNLILNVDDSANVSPSTSGNLTATSITGLSPAAINYAGVGKLTISLGSGGNAFTITNTNSTTATTLNSGTGNDTVTLVTDGGATTINTQNGSDTVYVEATGALTTINTGIPGADTIDVGSVLPPPLFNGGVLSGVTGKLVVNGNGDDTLNLDDSGDTASHTGVQLTATALTGLGAAEIDFSKLGALNLALGSGNNTVKITGTPSGTNTSITTAGGADVFNIQATASPLSISTTGSGVNTFNVGSLAPATGGNVDGIIGTVTLSGDSNDILNVDDTGSNKSRTGSLSGAALVLGPATIDYSGLASLNVNLDTGVDVFTVTSTAAGVASTLTTTVADTFNVQTTAATSSLTIKTGASASTVNITNSGIVGGIAGPVTVTGTGTAAIVNVDDSANTSPSTGGALTATAITGLSPAAINYSGVGKLTISFGSGGNAFTITNTNAATATTVNSGAGNDTVTLVNDSGSTTINTQSGTDTVYVNGTGGTTTINDGAGADLVMVGSLAPATLGVLDNIKGALSVNGAATTLDLDDTGSTKTKSASLTGTTVSGLSPAAITYAVSKLNINLGSGGDAFAVTATTSGTTTVVTGGVGSETFSITATTSGGLPAKLLGPITIDGGAGGIDSLTVDDSLDATGRNVTMTSSTISGLGATISDFNIDIASTKLGAGNDTVTITNVNTFNTSSINGGGGTNSLILNISGSVSGTLTLSNITLSGSIGGNLTGSITSTSPIATLSIGGALTGSLSGSSASSISVAGNLSGSLNITGTLTSLSIGGNDTGTIAAGAVGTVSAPSLTPGGGGVALAITQAGKLRTITALNTSGAALTGATFKVLYDGASGADPQAYIRPANTAATRFDLELTSPVGANFSLSRLDTSGGATANVRNVIVEGNLLATISSAEASYFGVATSTIGGVYLPADNIAAVSVWGNMTTNTIRVASLQGIAFDSLTVGKTTYQALSLTYDSAESLLFSPLATVPGAKTTTYYEAIRLPTETLKMAFNSQKPVALFIDGTEGDDDKSNDASSTINDYDFEEHGLQLTDGSTGAAASVAVTASAAFVANSATHASGISQLSIVGDGASIDSTASIGNITSTGPLGNIYLRGNSTTYAGVKETLSGITAPSITGNINLFGGSLTGTIQTTGVRYDPITGAASSVNADLGSTTGTNTVTGVTTLYAVFGAGARIISRGNLFSEVYVSGPLTGVIAAQGNIGVGVVASGKLTRFGGVQVGTGVSTGQIIADGNIFGDISIGGSFSGRIAAQGAAVAGLAATRLGILGNITLSGGMASGGAVISGGLIGDSTGGTKLTLAAASVLGFVAAKGALTASATLPAGHVFQNQTGANAAAIGAIWTNGGKALNFDINPGDLAGLTLILTDALALKASGANLTGTIV